MGWRKEAAFRGSWCRVAGTHGAWEGVREDDLSGLETDRLSLVCRQFMGESLRVNVRIVRGPA